MSVCEGETSVCAIGTAVVVVVATSATDRKGWKEKGERERERWLLRSKDNQSEKERKKKEEKCANQRANVNDMEMPNDCRWRRRQATIEQSSPLMWLLEESSPQYTAQRQTQSVGEISHRGETIKGQLQKTSSTKTEEAVLSAREVSLSLLVYRSNRPQRRLRSDRSKHTHTHNRARLMASNGKTIDIEIWSANGRGRGKSRSVFTRTRCQLKRRQWNMKWERKKREL